LSTTQEIWILDATGDSGRADLESWQARMLDAELAKQMKLTKP
jgi:hypothetical protein